MPGDNDKQEKISMVRSIFIGLASFAFTVVLIAGSGLQGSGLIA
jgi:hypothetical protein